MMSVLELSFNPPCAPKPGRLEVPEPAPKRLASGLFGSEAARPHPTVPVGRLTVVEIDLVDHPVAIKGVIFAQRLVQLIFRIPQIDAVNVGWNRTLDHVESDGCNLLMLGRPSAVQIGMVGRLQRR
jgi:hypothetical protein